MASLHKEKVMCKLFLLMLLHVATMSVLSQQHEPIDKYKNVPAKELLPHNSPLVNVNSLEKANQFANSKLSYKIINASNKTFGYDIYTDGRMLIHQPSVPGLQGNNGFKTKVDASKVAQLVIAKLQNGQMPPTVTIEEMKKLDVL